MKRAGNLYPKIYQYENLMLAFCKASRGKRSRPDVISFGNHLEANIHKLRQDLITHCPDLGHYRFFRVNDPKPRAICAASFPERVLHHAIMNVCEPVFESYAIFDSHACRKGKGNHNALARVQTFTRKYSWYLKLDIKKYFDSIDQGVMMDGLTRRFKDRELLDLFVQLLATYHTQPGKGLPIGNLISQHLANFYLGLFDHWIKEEMQVKGYVRYMDDFIVLGPDKSFVKEKLHQIQHYLNGKLCLTVKENVQLNRCCYGIPFLGYRVFSSHMRLSLYSRQRFVDKFRAYEKKWVEGEWSMGELVRHMEPLIAVTRKARTTALRQQIIERFGVLS